jgi:hypothetical protein
MHGLIAFKNARAGGGVALRVEVDQQHVPPCAKLAAKLTAVVALPTPPPF